MTLISLLISLLVERSYPHLQAYRQIDWLSRYVNAMQGSLGSLVFEGNRAALVLLLPLMLVVCLVLLLIDGMLFGFLELVFSVAVLIYALGPKDLNQEVEEYIKAYEFGDDGELAVSAGAIYSGAVAAEKTEQVRQVASGILTESNKRLFSVLFWFVVLGPFGALLYRFSCQITDYLQAEKKADDVCISTAEYFVSLLQWLPARAVAASYILAGSFEDGLAGWRKYASEPVNITQSNDAILSNTGCGALKMDVQIELDADPALVRRARGLVLRTVVIWMVAIAVLTLVGWL